MSSQEEFWRDAIEQLAPIINSGRKKNESDQHNLMLILDIMKMYSKSQGKVFIVKKGIIYGELKVVMRERGFNILLTGSKRLLEAYCKNIFWEKEKEREAIRYSKKYTFDSKNRKYRLPRSKKTTFPFKAKRTSSFVFPSPKLSKDDTPKYFQQIDEKSGKRYVIYGFEKDKDLYERSKEKSYSMISNFNGLGRKKDLLECVESL